MPSTVFSQALKNKFVESGMKVYLLKADNEDDLFEKFESLRKNSTLKYTAFHMMKSQEEGPQPKTAVVLLGARSFVVTEALLKDARSMALNGSGEEIIDLRKENADSAGMGLR